MFDQFFNQYNNKFVEKEDPTNKNQCLDLIFAYVDALSIPRETVRHLYAYEAYTKPTDATVRYFELVPNTPLGIPQKGDIVVWDKKYNGTAGHIGIANGKGNINNFECFEQNDPVGTSSHIKVYTYSFILGWLRVKTSSDEINKLKKQVQDLQKVQQSLQKDIEKFKQKIQKATQALNE